MKRPNRVISTLALAALAAFGLSACAQSATPAAAPAGSQVEAGSAMYASLLDQVAGTAEQRRAGAERAWIGQQAALSGCVAKLGQTYGMPLYPGGEDTVPAPGDLLAFAPAREDFGVAKRLAAYAAAPPEVKNPGLAKATTLAEENSFFKAVEGCQGAAKPFEDDYVPVGQPEVRLAFVKTLEKIQRAATPTLVDDYARCMGNAGIAAEDRPDLYIQVSQKFPSTKLIKGAADLNSVPGWADAVAFEQQAAAADAACRADAVEVAMAAAGPELTAFAKTNAAALAKVSAGWAQAETDAQALRAKYNIK